MRIELTEVLQWLGVFASGVAGWLWKELVSIRRDHTKLKDDHANHKTHVAERYVTKDDMNTALSRVYDSLDRIEKKLDER